MCGATGDRDQIKFVERSRQPDVCECCSCRIVLVALLCVVAALAVGGGLSVVCARV